MEGLSNLRMNEIKVINDIKVKLEDKLNKEDCYTIESDLKWGTSSGGLRFDIVVKQRNIIIAVFEIKQSSRGVDLVKRKMFNYVISHTPARIFVLYNFNEDKYILFERGSDDESTVCFDDIISKIQFYKGLPYDKENNSNQELKFYKNIEKILDPEYCREQLGTLSINKICRYTSLESIFATIKYKTLRMNGLPGMNDRTEGLFAWSLLYNPNELENDELRKSMSEINNAYIVSFSHEDKIDDLTQWRLYGDDAQGVCCVYSIIQHKIKDRFFLHDIKYINPQSYGGVINDSHLESLRNYIKDQNKLTYLDLSPTIFFYKSEIFASEKEIRLLVDNKNTSAYKRNQYQREWLLTNSNKIPNPYIDVFLDDIPLKLEKILLGPNMKDVDTIQVQLETMLHQQNINAKVELSKISGYRNSI